MPRPYEPGPVLRVVAKRLFSDVQIDAGWSDQVQRSAERGVVVYIMRSLSFLDFFSLHILLARLALPLLYFVNDLGLGLAEPFGKGIRRMRFQRSQSEDEALRHVVNAKRSALLFLRRPPRFGSRARRGQAFEGDLIQTLVVAQRSMEQAILLQPQTFIWNMRPASARRGPVDMFFGPVEWPGRLRVFFQFLFNRRNAKLRSGEPLDLQAFLKAHPDLSDELLADKVRYALLRVIERERRLVVGPRQKTPQRLREELLRSPRVRQQIESRARRSKTSVRAIERSARRELRRLGANPQPWMFGLLERLLTWVFRRIYDGLVVDEEGVERVRAAARQGTLVFLPSHKSHVDYLVLSYVLHQRAFSTPLIAAGDNLAFFPLGPILRRGGAFFIRRNLAGRKLYSNLLDAYIRKLLAHGFNIEFFLEGGRSRTGKLRAPRLGLLSMIVDAARKTPRRNVHFVPVSIGYERVIEQSSYESEVAGGMKEVENARAILRAPEILRSKYGRLYVQFGEIISLNELDPDAAVSPRQKRALVQTLAERVSYQIDHVTTVTPAALLATALLMHRRRAVAKKLMFAQAAALLEHLESSGARIANTLTGASFEETLSEALGLLVDTGLVWSHPDLPMVRVPDPRRIALEYYKNNLLHFFVARVVVLSVMARHGDELEESALKQESARLSALFRHEFSRPTAELASKAIDEAIADLVAQGDLRRDGHHLRSERKDPLKPPLKPPYSEMLRSILEAYRLAIRVLKEETDLTTKDWAQRSLQIGQRAYLAGDIELRESVSKPKLENALLAFRELGLVRQRGESLIIERKAELEDWFIELGEYLREEGES